MDSTHTPQTTQAPTTGRPPVAPSVSEMLSSARSVESRLEDEFYPMGWEERLEAANLVRAIIAGLRQLHREGESR